MRQICDKHLSNLVIWAYACFLACGALGCSASKKSSEPEVRELTPTEESSIDTTYEESFETAKKLYSSRLFSVAAQHFDNIKTTFPVGAYTEFSQIKAADAKFEGNEYQEALVSYEDFLRDYPASPSADYVLLRVGNCHELSNRGIGRDVATLEEAMKAYKRLISEFPESIYVSLARERYSIVLNLIAKHEQSIIDYYKKRGLDKAAKAREEKYSMTLAPELAKLDIKKAKGSTSSARKNLKKAPSPMLLASQRIAPVEDNARASFALKKTDSPTNSTKGNIVSTVECSEKQVTFYLGEDFQDSAFKRYTYEENEVSFIRLGFLTHELPALTCASSQLSMFEDGDLHGIQVPDSKNPKIFEIDNPKRIIVRLGS